MSFSADHEEPALGLTSPRFLQEVRDRITLSEIVRAKVKLVRAGREFKGCCPFHNEKSPSFYVNDDKQFFHCFGCGAHGDIFGFVMRHDNLSFYEALQILAEQAGLSLPKYRNDSENNTSHDSRLVEHKAQAEEQKILLQLCEQAGKWFEEQLFLPCHREVLNYVEGRGLSRDTIHNFRIGFAPLNDSALKMHLFHLGFTLAQCVKAGLLKVSQKNKTATFDPNNDEEKVATYGFFRERVIFPVCDNRGRIIAFGGRTLPDFMRAPQRGDFTPPKYLNSIETSIFHKGKTLYGIQHARSAAKDEPLLVVEGYMDVIAAQQAGLKGAVAPLGTALTEDQILKLWRMIPHESKEPILCFDGDEAGYRAALRAADRVIPLLRSYHSLKFVFLPSGQDPDTFIRSYGVAEFRSLLRRSVALVDFLWFSITRGRKFETPEEKAGLTQQCEDLVNKINDRNLQYHYRTAFRTRIHSLFAMSQPALAAAQGNYKINEGAGRSGSRDITKRRYKKDNFFDRKVRSDKFSDAPPVILPHYNIPPIDVIIPQVLMCLLIGFPQLYSLVHEDCYRLSSGDKEFCIWVEKAIEIIESYQDELSHEHRPQDGRDAITCSMNNNSLLENLRACDALDYYFYLQNRPYIKTHMNFLKHTNNIDEIFDRWKAMIHQWDMQKTQRDAIHAGKLFSTQAHRQDLVQSLEQRLLALKEVQHNQETMNS